MYNCLYHDWAWLLSYTTGDILSSHMPCRFVNYPTQWFSSKHLLWSKYWNCHHWWQGYCHTFCWNSLVFATGICPGISQSMQTSMVMSWGINAEHLARNYKNCGVSALSAFKMHVFLTTSTQICLLDLLHPDYVKENQSEMLRYLSGSSEQ